MARSRLKNKANKSEKEEDLKAHKKQRNLVLKLNRKTKKNLIVCFYHVTYEFESESTLTCESTLRIHTHL